MGAASGLIQVTLDREDIEAIAQRLVQLVDHSAGRSEFVGVVQVARHLGVSGGWFTGMPTASEPCASDAGCASTSRRSIAFSRRRLHVKRRRQRPPCSPRACGC